MKLLTMLFLGGSLMIAIYLNSVLDKRESKREERKQGTSN